LEDTFPSLLYSIAEAVLGRVGADSKIPGYLFPLITPDPLEEKVSRLTVHKAHEKAHELLDQNPIVKLSDPARVPRSLKAFELLK
jgi:hypothetical protein